MEASVTWDNVVFQVESIDTPPIGEFLSAFGSVYVNGGVIVRSYRMAKETHFDHGLQHYTKSTDQIFRALLTNPSVMSALPELEIRLPLKPVPRFSLLSAFAMEGELTHLLLCGGAYQQYESVARARKLTRRFMESLVGEKMQNVGLAGYSSTPWTTWYYNAAWDATFVLYQQKARRFVVICLTDTD